MKTNFETQTNPEIFKYSTLLAFLTDVFNNRKKQNPAFSYEIWSHELGFKSTSLMYLISRGQRAVTASTAIALSRNLRLNADEKKYLLMLAGYDQAKSPEMKTALHDKILENFQYPEMTIEADHYANFMLSPTMPLIKMILSYDDTRGTKDEILNFLKISPEQLDADLAQLEFMGLVRKEILKTGEIAWKATSKALRIPEEKNQTVMNQYYKNSLNESAEILENTNLFKKFRNLVLAIDPNDYKVLENEVDQFVSKLKNKFAYNNLNHKQLLKINLQAYQASETKKPRE